MSSHTSSISLDTTTATHHHSIYDSKKAEANVGPAIVDFSKESDDSEVGEPQQEYAAEAADAHHGELHRAFKSRHIQMIGLGGNVGSGLFISTGKALRYGSAPGMLIGYPLLASMLFAMLQTLTEATCLFPTSGSFVDHAARFVDPALGFAIGFLEWFGALTTLAAEGAIWPVIISYWTTSIPTAACMTIYLAIVIFFLCMPVRWYAEWQFATGAAKVTLMVVVILSMIAIVCGAGPTGSVSTAANYTQLPAFPNGFKGVANTFLLAAWAVTGQEIMGISAGEATMPRFSMPRASVNVVARLAVIYTLGVALITIAVPYTSPQLLNTSGNIATSPFVIAMTNAGIKVLPDITNVVLLVGLAGIGTEGLYQASRIQTAMARMGMMPSIFNRVDSQGRPYWSLLCCVSVACILTYINCSTSGAVAFTWFSSISAFVSLIAWTVIPITNWYMHRALRAQGDRAFQERYAYRNRFWPCGSVFLFTASVVVIGCTFYVSLFPIGGPPNATNFFENFLCLPFFLVVYLAYKLWFRTKMVDPLKADLKSGRRPLTEADYVYLDQYYSQPMWRRAMSYLRF